MKEKAPHFLKRLFCSKGIKLYPLRFALVLSLLASWLWLVPVTAAYEQAQGNAQDCTPNYDPPDFSVDVTPASQTLQQGEVAAYALTVNTLNCYTETVTLSVTGLPSNTTYAIDPASVTPPADSSLVVTTTTSTPAGTYPLTISGDSGALHREASVDLIVDDPVQNDPDFSIAASPASQTVDAGDGTDYAVSLDALHGFTGTVSLSVTGLPGGADATFSPTDLTPPGGSTLAVSTSIDTPAGTYPLTISGDSGALHHEASVDLIVNDPVQNDPDFSIVASPASQTVYAGDDTAYAVGLDALHGFTGTVSLSVTGLPSGADATFSPTDLAPPGGSTLAVSTSIDTPAGTYPLTISGDSGALHHEANVDLIVDDPVQNDPDFSIAASPASQTVDAGDGTDYAVSLDALHGFTGTVSLSITGLPGGADATFSPTDLTPPGGSTLAVSTSIDTPAGTYPLTISGDSGALHHEANVDLIVNDPVQNDPDFSVAASPASQTVDAGDGTDYAVSLDALHGFTGTVSLSVTGLPSGADATFNPIALTPPGGSTLAITTGIDTPAGTYPLTISGDSGALHHEAGVTLVVNEGMSQTVVRVHPAANSMFVGQMATSQILLDNANDFYGAEFFLTYDPAVLRVVDADPSTDGVQVGLGELFPNDEYVVGANKVFTSTGQIVFGVARRAPALPVNGDGVLATITWEAIGEGVSDLSFTHLKLANPSGFELEAISQDGSMNTTETGILSGTVHLQGRTDHSGAEVNVSPVGLQAITDLLGLFQIMTHGTLTVTAQMYGYLDAQTTADLLPGEALDLGTALLYGGEVTGDDLIDIGDLAYLGARFHTSDLSADINGDDQVDILDLAMAAANFMKSGPTPWSE